MTSPVPSPLPWSIALAAAAIDSKLNVEFVARDRDGDGALSQAEYHAGHGRHDGGKRK